MIKKKMLLLLLLLSCLALFSQTIELKTESASCLVDIEGARILSCVLGDEVLWNDTPRQTRAADWAHGGIPVCWPWFGRRPNKPIHGTAWQRRFKLLDHSEGPTRSELKLELEDGADKLKYVITLSDALTLAMTSENLATGLQGGSLGFHPYFRVSERDRCVLRGINSMKFEDDDSVAAAANGVWRGDLKLTSTIDRIFQFPDLSKHTVRLDDPVLGRTIVVESEGASALNVWNPGAEKQCPGVVPGDEWRRFVCVEPIAKPGRVSTCTLKMTIRLERLGKVN